MDDAYDLTKIEDLVQQGHTDHCAARMVWGDGECTCPGDGSGSPFHTLNPPSDGWPTRRARHAWMPFGVVSAALLVDLASPDCEGPGQVEASGQTGGGGLRHSPLTLLDMLRGDCDFTVPRVPARDDCEGFCA